MFPILRFAPSPTGKIHIGNLRAALLNFLYAKKYSGKFILRIDDTDVERSKIAYTEQIKSDLKWLGITWDETFEQSSRITNYSAAVAKLFKLGFLYKCYETKEELEVKRKIQLSQKKPPVYDRTSLFLTDDEKAKLEAEGVPYYWRFKLNQKRIGWDDLIHGRVEINASSISDPIIKKSDGMFVYSLASVVDDIDFGITHIIRGDDHVTNTAVQLEMFAALGKNISDIKFGHYPLLQNTTGDEFSKRNNSMSIEYFRESLLDPMALNSIMAKIGTSDPIVPCDSMKYLVDTFNVSKISKARPKFDVNEVFKINRKLLSNMSYEKVKLIAKDVDFSEGFWNLIKNDIDNIAGIKVWVNVLYGEVADINFSEEELDFLKFCAKTLESYTEYDEWLSVVKKTSGRSGKLLFHPIRLAVTGLENGPELLKLLKFISREKIFKRLMCNK